MDYSHEMEDNEGNLYRQSKETKPKKLTRKEKKEQKKREIIYYLKCGMVDIFHESCYTKEGDCITPRNFDDMMHDVINKTIELFTKRKIL